MPVSSQDNAYPMSVRRVWPIAVALLFVCLKPPHAAEPNAVIEPNLTIEPTAAVEPTVPSARGPTLDAALRAARVALDSCKTRGFAASVSIVDANYTTRSGGLVIAVDGDIIGAIGVGGAHPSEVDESCALIGLESIKHQLK